MSSGNPLQREQLEDAFQVFNQVSEQLVVSYQQLQEQVQQLSAELAAVRQERMRQLMEKERLANRLSQLLDALPAAVVVLGGDDRIQAFNQAAQDLLGPIDLHQGWGAIYQRHFGTGQSGEERQLRSGRWVSLSERSLTPEPGRILLLRDITESRELQERMHRQQRLAAMGEMAAQLAHQIRTPLSSALLYLSHLSKQNLSSGQRSRMAERSRARLLHMEHQINDMLAFARGGQYAPEPVAMSELLRDLVQTLEPAIQESNVSLQWRDDTTGDCRVSGNRDALLGAVLNLANNAIQHGGPEVALLIALRRPCDHETELSVCDNGPGIRDEIRERVFDPFFTTSSGGTGLGLAVVQSVVLGHRGRIDLDSAADEGTCFRIRLPLAETADQAGLPKAAVADFPEQPISLVRSSSV